MRAQLSLRDYENLSAYLDEQLSRAEKARLEERLRTNSELRLALDEMSRTRALLRTAPRHRAPRNFTLTSSMVQSKKPVRGSIFNLFPVLSFASAVATLALVFSLFFQPGYAPGLAGSAVPAANQAQKAAEDSAQTLEMPAEAARSAAEPASEPAPEAMPGAAPEAEMKVQSAEEATTAGKQEGPVIVWNGGSSAPPLDGRGGGGGGGGYGGDMMGGAPSGGAYGGQMFVPLEGVESLPAQSAMMADAERDSQFSGVPEITGAGPILGVPAPDRAGEYLEPLPTFLPAPIEQPMPTSESFADESEVETADAPATPANGLSLAQLRMIQISLGVLALVTGISAWWVWQKNR